MQHDLFDEVIGTPPPSTVDQFAIVRREKRRRTERRAGVLAAVAVLALSASTMTALTRATPGTPATTDSSPQEQTQFRLIADDRPSAEATAKRLSAALDRSLKYRAPGARWVTGDLPGQPQPDGQPPTLLSWEAARANERMFQGTGAVLIDGHLGILGLQINSIKPCTWNSKKCAQARVEPGREKRLRERMLTCAADRGSPAVTACREDQGPKGERIKITKISSQPPKLTSRWPFTDYYVSLGLTDGRVLTLNVGNSIVGNGRAQKDTIAQQDPPLTAEQLTSIATDLSGKIIP